MKKFLLMLALMLPCLGAWAEIEVSTSVETPENTYSLLSKNGLYMSAGTGSTQFNIGRFAFYGGTNGAYKIYSVDAQRWVSYTQVVSYSGNGGADKAILIESQEDALEWNVVANGEHYNIAPYLKNGDIAGFYWNFYGGIGAYAYDNNKTVGLYNDKGDGGSLWKLEKLTLATADDVIAAKALVVVGLGYPKTTTSAYKAMDALTVGKLTTKHIEVAKTAYISTSDIQLPEDGKAYKMALVANNNDETKYYFTAKGNTRDVSTDASQASTFYCTQIETSNGIQFVFISEEGKFLAYRTLTDQYTYSGNLMNNCTVSGMSSKSSGYITSTPEKRLGTFYITTDARANNDITDGCFILKFTANPVSFDNSGAPYHNDTYTSAIVMSEVESFEPNQAQTTAVASVRLGLSKNNALIELQNKTIGDKVCQYTYTINGNTVTTSSDIKIAINNATTVEEVNTIKATAKLNLPVEGKLYRIKNSNGERYLSSGTGTGRTKFLTGIGENASSIFLYTGGKLVSYTTGLYLANQNNFLHYTNTVGANAGTTIKFVETGAYNKVGIKFNNDNRSLYSNNSDDSNAAGSGSATGTDGNYHFTIEEVTWLPIPVNVEAGWTTLYSPVELELSEGRVKAYTVSKTSETFATLVEQTVVPAGVGVVLELQQGAEVVNDCVFLKVKATETTNVTSVLLGTYADEFIATDAYVLTLGDGEDKVVFGQAKKNFNDANAKVEDGVKWLNNGFKAYLPASAVPSAVQALRFNFGGTTSIEDAIITPSFDTNAPIYDLSGRRVMNAVKGGLYIQNGKKFIVR